LAKPHNLLFFLISLFAWRPVRGTRNCEWIVIFYLFIFSSFHLLLLDAVSDKSEGVFFGVVF
jgi:hypothetical protein